MKIILSFVSLVIVLSTSFAQSVEIEGSLKITQSTLESSPGTIRWTGCDFEGWNGYKWLSLTNEVKVQDGCGNCYSTIEIGDQIWLDGNLRTTKYNDGTDIPLATNISEWAGFSGAQAPGMCWYDDDQLANEFPYGALYNFYALDTMVNGNKNVCPPGFHVPSKAELDSLQSALGGAMTSGARMKVTGTNYWSAPNDGTDNSSDFSAYPAGRRGPNGTFAAKGSTNYLRSSTPHPTSAPNAHYGLLSSGNQAFNVNIWNRGIGMSVRCISD